MQVKKNLTSVDILDLDQPVHLGSLIKDLLFIWTVYESWEIQKVKSLITLHSCTG